MNNSPLVNLACIIDDDKLYVSLLNMIIKKNNLAADILVFTNGQMAEEFFRTEVEKNNPNLPEIVLLDLNMPVMDGWEFLQAIAPLEHKLNQQGVHLNVVSSTISPDEVRKAKGHSIVKKFLTKPISKTAMIEAFTLS